MKNTSMKKLAVVAALACACAVAWAENVLYIHPGSDSRADGLITPGYAFVDKISTSLSVAIWVKDMTGNSEKFIAGVPGCWNLAILHTGSVDTNRKLAFRTNSGNALAGGYVLDDHNWHFLVGTFNYDGENSFQRLYVDGVLVAAKTDGISALPTPTKAFSIGADTQGMRTPIPDSCQWTGNVSGYFAELSVWGRALTDSEVSALYTKRVGGNESGLVAYWPLTGTPGMALAEYKFANLANATGEPKLNSYYLYYNNKDRFDIVPDDDFTKPYVRYVASPEWCAAHSYVQQENATGRSWNDPFTNLVDTATNVAKKFERILCSPGTHKIASSISPRVTYFYLGSYDPDTGKPCPETAIIDAQGLCRHFISTSDTTGHQSGFTVENLTFVNGHVAGGSGGSMYFKTNTGKINNCIFHDNTATVSGGAYYAVEASGTVVSNCQFYGNSSTQNGGAVFLSHSQESSARFQKFVDCVFTNNTSTAAKSEYGGGAVCADKKIELANCLFADNVATSGMGGHAYVGINSILKGCVFTGTCRASYGTCMATRKNPVSITSCVFRNLTCSGASFDFIRFANSGSGINIVDCVFTNNANATPLFYQQSKNLLFRQCLIAGNASNKTVVDDRSSSARFENCTIGQAYFDTKSSGACTNVLVNCILPNATITSSGNYCNILSNCLVKVAQNGPYDSGVITGSAGFKDAAHGDYTLKPGSQCREKGLTLGWMTDGSTDLLGNPRVVDREGNAFTAAALPDLGCYEIQERCPGFMMIFW